MKVILQQQLQRGAGPIVFDGQAVTSSDDVVGIEDRNGESMGECRDNVEL